VINFLQFPLESKLKKISTRYSIDLLEEPSVSVKDILNNEFGSTILNDISSELDFINNSCIFLQSSKKISDFILNSQNKYLICNGSSLVSVSNNFIYENSTEKRNKLHPYFYLHGYIFGKPIYINNFLPHNVMYLIDGIDLYKGELGYYNKYYNEDFDSNYVNVWIDFNFKINGNVESILIVKDETDPNYKDYILQNRKRKIGRILNK
jgi:hypothetical protein